MRFHHAVPLTALAIAPVCAERIKFSDEQAIVDFTRQRLTAWIAAAAFLAPAATAMVAAVVEIRLLE